MCLLPVVSELITPFNADRDLLMLWASLSCLPSEPLEDHKAEINDETSLGTSRNQP